jgi:hypothetical protein
MGVGQYLYPRSSHVMDIFKTIFQGLGQSKLRRVTIERYPSLRALALIGGYSATGLESKAIAAAGTTLTAAAAETLRRKVLRVVVFFFILPICLI